MNRTQLSREDADESMRLEAPRPPLTVVKGRVFCDVCSTAFKPFNRHDTHPQCPWCGSLVDLTAIEHQQGVSR